ncbi:hypothetical protein [Actinoplanes couchii]|uniref:Nucleotidyltransferase n=1 Tax=Actinoplanes couchii TaxID=403638 RepID=A0ABQ3XLG7_9ACTN|nr:hypothetical protein [Actinoplanes couchii]MDR6318280.1 hypothetical protein [Actinoplanes couchii]GID59350.1 nucleotidyltransferase [Actinoplanes couchii]
MEAVLAFGDELAKTGFVSDLLIAGSLASGDYVAGVSDLDLVAVTDGAVDETVLASLHRPWDHLNLGCVYVSPGADVGARHPTWTHGMLVRRILSGITRAELVTFGRTVFGRAPGELFPAMTADDIRAAGRAELTGYWAWAARRPWMFADPVIADLSLTSMARGRHVLRTGTLLTKSDAVDRAAAPPWLISQLRARRHGGTEPSPRLRTAWISWRDARRTTRMAR